MRYFIAVAIMAITLSTAKAEEPEYWFDTNHGPQWPFGKPSGVRARSVMPTVRPKSTLWTDTDGNIVVPDEMRFPAVSVTAVSTESLLREEVKELRDRAETAESRADSWFYTFWIAQAVGLVPWAITAWLWLKRPKLPKKL